DPPAASWQPPGSETRSAEVAPAVSYRTQALGTTLRPECLYDVRCREDPPAPPGADEPERRMALAHEEGVSQPVVQGRGRVLAARRDGNLVPEAARGNDIVLVARLVRPH